MSIVLLHESSNCDTVGFLIIGILLNFYDRVSKYLCYLLRTCCFFKYLKQDDLLISFTLTLLHMHIVMRLLSTNSSMLTGIL